MQGISLTKRVPRHVVGNRRKNSDRQRWRGAFVRSPPSLNGRYPQGARQTHTHKHTHINTALTAALFYASDLSSLPYGLSAQCLGELPLRRHRGFSLFFVGWFIYLSVCLYSICSKSTKSNARGVFSPEQHISLSLSLSLWLYKAMFFLHKSIGHETERGPNIDTQPFSSQDQ